MWKMRVRSWGGLIAIPLRGRLLARSVPVPLATVGRGNDLSGIM